MRALTADDTRRIASDLIGGNKQAINILREQGSCDISFGLPGLARFRVNIFIQRGSCAVVMRVIPTTIPEFSAMGLPPQLREIADLRDGIVLVTGARGAGKSSTLAALLDRINEKQTCHIITIEDPIEFLHNHKKATIHQRELHSDTPNFAVALRAALRQAPKVILLGEMRDRDTMEVAMEAAETGHLVLSTLHTIDAAKTVERIIGVFYDVYNELGQGFLESVYHNAMVVALQQVGLAVEPKVPVPVRFRGQQVGDFEVDILVERLVLLELKAVRALESAHEAQTLNYLRATPIEVALLLNFGPKPQVRQFAFENDRKRSVSKEMVRV